MRDVTVLAADEGHLARIVDAVRPLPGIEVEHVSDRTFLLHLGGKLGIAPKVPLKTRDDLSMAHTPGVARVCRAIADEPDKVWNLTVKQNTVAVVTDGTAVLGLEDIGPEAALPVMEERRSCSRSSRASTWPICLATTDTDEIVRTVAAIAPVFGGINLEDISAPRCFEIERRLREGLDIPVFHDDQHGTAVVVLAALINALGLVNKRLEDARIVITGAGAAGARNGANAARRRRSRRRLLRPARCRRHRQRRARPLQGTAGGGDEPPHAARHGQRGTRGRGRLHRAFRPRSRQP